MKVACLTAIGLIIFKVINCGSNSDSNNNQRVEVIVHDPFDRYYNDYNYSNDYYEKNVIERKDPAVHFSEYNSSEDVQYNRPDVHENFNDLNQPDVHENFKNLNQPDVHENFKNLNQPIEYKQHSSKFNSQGLNINKSRNLHPSTQKIYQQPPQPIQENNIQNRQAIVNKDGRQQSNINTRQFPQKSNAYQQKLQINSNEIDINRQLYAGGHREMFI